MAYGDASLIDRELVELPIPSTFKSMSEDKSPNDAESQEDLVVVPEDDESRVFSSGNLATSDKAHEDVLQDESEAKELAVPATEEDLC